MILFFLKLNSEIRLEFLGKARVHWTEHHTNGQHRETRHYSANELYFNNVVTVFGKGTCIVCLLNSSSTDLKYINELIKFVWQIQRSPKNPDHILITSIFVHTCNTSIFCFLYSRSGRGRWTYFTPGTTPFSILLYVTSQFALVIWGGYRTRTLRRQGYNRQTVEVWWQLCAGVYSTQCSGPQPTAKSKCKKFIKHKHKSVSLWSA